jgi:hypothetical protein
MNIIKKEKKEKNSRTIKKKVLWFRPSFGNLSLKILDIQKPKQH